MRFHLLFAVKLILFTTYTLFAGSDNYSIGARSAGLGNASVTLTDPWSVYHNQAGLARLDKISFGIDYSNRFSLSELSTKSLVAGIPTNFGVVGVSFSYFGYSLYNNSKVGLAYARSFGDNFSAGLQFNYMSTRLGENYGEKGSMTIEAGVLAQLNKNLSVGAHIFNPTRTRLLEYEIQQVTLVEHIPTIMRFGLNYTFSEKVFVTLETEKDIGFRSEERRVGKECRSRWSP